MQEPDHWKTGERTDVGDKPNPIIELPAEHKTVVNYPKGVSKQEIASRELLDLQAASYVDAGDTNGYQGEGADYVRVHQGVADDIDNTVIRFVASQRIEWHIALYDHIPNVIAEPRKHREEYAVVGFIVTEWVNTAMPMTARVRARLQRRNGVPHKEVRTIVTDDMRVAKAFEAIKREVNAQVQGAKVDG